MPTAPAPIAVFGTPRAALRWTRVYASPALPFRAYGFDGEPLAEPAACVAVERFPEEWPAAAVRRLLDRFPLSSWIVACGPWANGGARTGSPWPPALRCGDAEALRRTAAALRGEPTPGPLGDAPPPPAPPASVGPVTVHSSDAAYREATAALLSGADGPPWEAWDLDAWDARQAAALARSRLRAPDRVRVGLTAFAARPAAGGFDHLAEKWAPPDGLWAAVQSAAAASND